MKPWFVIGALAAVLLAAVTLLGDWESPRHDNTAQLHAIRDAALDYAQTHARLPATLEALNLPAPPEDRWGHPIRYEVSSDGRSAVLTSLGPDGVEGGMMMKRDTNLRFTLED